MGASAEPRFGKFFLYMQSYCMQAAHGKTNPAPAGTVIGGQTYQS
jgi:hypothetical protein